MDDDMDVPPKTVAREESRRERTKDREDKRRERDARERRFDKEERAPRRVYTHEKRGSQERSDRKERERDYKRRKSATPPPAHKDRRHSPPPPRSPPYKRRREVVHEGSRRRSIGDEGGRGLANDNRLGGFNETRLYLSGKIEGHREFTYTKFQDFNMQSCSTISYLDSHVSRKKALLTYKQFIVELEDDILPKEAQYRYEAYKKEHIIIQKQAYFKKHKDDDWLREKYDPVRLEAVLVRRNENAKIHAKELMSELQVGALDLAASVQASTKEEYDSDVDCGVKRRKSLRIHLKRQEYNDACKEHFECYDSKRILIDFDLERSLIKKLDAEKGIEENILLSNRDSEDDSIDKGPTMTMRSCKQIKEMECAKLSEVMRIYLWRVHFVDYYGMIEYKEQPKKMQLITAPKTKNQEDTQNDKEDSVFVEWEKKLETTWQTRLKVGDLIESMLSKETLQTTANDALNTFVRKIRDEKYGWKYGCGAKGCIKLFHGAEFVHKHLKLKHSDLVMDVVRKAQEELYFQNYMSDADAPGVNQTTSIHLKRTSHEKSRKSCRHSISKTIVKCDEQQKSIVEQPLNVERHQPNEIKCASRTNDTFEECTRTKELDEHLECGRQEQELQLEKSEVLKHFPPPHFFPCLERARPSIFQGRHIEGCFEHLPMEPIMFDHFNGPPLQGLPGGLFAPNIHGPPQVLMPVPGAGPLGPFVPAPPGMAMRFMMEGPDCFSSAFERGFLGNDNGRLRGRKRQVLGPLLESGLLDVSSIMVPPHVLHKDPRGIRSYHDLDMPEDEVTVIDYRSL